MDEPTILWCRVCKDVVCRILDKEGMSVHPEKLLIIQGELLRDAVRKFVWELTKTGRL